MPPSALALALAAAFIHALWNFLLARAREPEAATVVALVAAVVAFAPAAAVAWRVEVAVWPYIVATAALELLYFALLAAAYRRAELSVVYPLARGTAPVLVLAFGVIALGAGTSWGQAAGVSLVAAGVLFVRGLRRRADPAGVAFGLVIAGCIAAYTLVDKGGIRYADPIAYLELAMLPATIGYAGAVVAAKGLAPLRSELKASSVLAGIATFGAYTLVLAALRIASAASVAAVRETSVIIATAAAGVVLKERVGRSRMVGAVLVVGGIALLGLS